MQTASEFYGLVCSLRFWRVDCDEERGASFFCVKSILRVPSLIFYFLFYSILFIDSAQFIWYTGSPAVFSAPTSNYLLKCAILLVQDGLLRRVSCALVSPSPTLSGALLVWTYASSCNKPKLTARVVRLVLLIEDGPSSEVGHLRKHFILAIFGDILLWNN